MIVEQKAIGLNIIMMRLLCYSIQKVIVIMKSDMCSLEKIKHN